MCVRESVGMGPLVCVYMCKVCVGFGQQMTAAATKKNCVPKVKRLIPLHSTSSHKTHVPGKSITSRNFYTNSELDIIISLFLPLY